MREARWVLGAGGRLAVLLVASAYLHVVIAAGVWGLPRILAALGKSTPAATDPSPALAGETFELPAPPTVDVPLASASPTVDQRTASEGEAEVADAPAEHPAKAAKPKGAAAKVASRPTRPSGGRTEGADPDAKEGSGSSGSLYGAVGDRSAADVATAFTRAFPEAASGDPAWRDAPLGAAGEATLTLTLDEAGHLVDTQVSGSTSPALAAGIRRTIALVKGRPFTSKARVTKLHLVASVSSDAVHDGLHGDVFAIGGSYAGGEGTAFFALAVGRRIDLRVRSR